MVLFSLNVIECLSLPSWQDFHLFSIFFSFRLFLIRDRWFILSPGGFGLPIILHTSGVVYNVAILQTTPTARLMIACKRIKLAVVACHCIPGFWFNIEALLFLMASSTYLPVRVFDQTLFRADHPFLIYIYILVHRALVICSPFKLDEETFTIFSGIMFIRRMSSNVRWNVR